MDRPLRPTLRCVIEDLVADWENVDHFRAVQQGRRPGVDLHDLAHPLIKAMAMRYGSPADAEAVAARENISGTRDPTWWKAKTSRWRGAVYIDPETDQAWLCAAGLRYEDEVTKDFYKVFTAEVAATGPKRFLPTQQDLDELARERADRDLASWEIQVTSAVIQAVADVAPDGPQSVDLPDLSGQDVPRLEVELFELDQEEWADEAPEDMPAEVSLRLVISDWSNPRLLARLQVLVCLAIAPGTEAWDAVPGEDFSRVMQATIDESRLAQLRAAARLDDGSSHSAAAPGDVPAISSAHWTRKTFLAKALVLGQAVPALCGTWFVPVQDPGNLPICEECSSAFDELDA